MAPILVNGSPTSGFHFCCGLKQGDPLAHFRFIFIMESFHISVTRTVGDGVFKGLSIQGSDPLSHLFYADDVVFLGEWSETNLVNLVKILDCFHLAPCLKINLIKSQVLGIGIPRDIVSQGASRIGCDVLRTPFKYFGVTVGFEGGFARNGVDPKYVFYWQRSGRQKDHLDRWDKVLSSKKKGGLGARVTNAIYGSNISSHDDKLSSNWCFIPCEIQCLLLLNGKLPLLSFLFVAIFDSVIPRRSVIYDGIVTRSYHWCGSRCTPGYYTRMENRSLYGKKMTSLEEKVNRYLEETMKERAKTNQLIKKLKEGISTSV
nr:RNA-directed DNA polymerase, eukaryota [Tanacetum cinerariifolium]